MNIFASDAVLFRRGVHPRGADDDDDDVIGAPQAATTTAALASALTTSASPLSRSSRAGRPYPDAPYYGVLKELELWVDVLVPPRTNQKQKLASSTEGHLPRRTNAAHAFTRLPMMHEHLEDVVRRHGNVYFLGSQPIMQNAALAGGELGGPPPTASAIPARSASPSNTMTTSLAYSIYINGLNELFSSFCRLRDAARSADSSSSSVPADVLYVRIIAHPRWKDVDVMLCVEKGRLLLYLSASSKTTQQHLSAQAERLGVEMAWLAGAALLTEPTLLAHDAPNPVLVVFVVFLHLELTNNVISTHARQSAELGAAVPAPLEEVLHGFQVEVLSSIAFSGAELHRPQLRLVSNSIRARIAGDVEVSEANEGVSTVDDDDVGGRRITTPAAVRRLVWRLCGPVHVLHPRLLQALVCCLVEECKLSAFSLWVAGDATRSLGMARLAKVDGGGDVSGLHYLTGLRQRDAWVAHGSSSLSWLSYSRLSSQLWIDAAERRRVARAAAAGQAGTGEEKDEHVADGDDDDDDVECEFHLRGIHYDRPTHKCDAGKKRERDDDDDDDDEGVAHFFMDVEISRIMNYGDGDVLLP